MAPPSETTPAYESAEIRSIAQKHGLNVQRMHHGQPILEPVAGHSWESKVVLNPGVALVTHKEQLESMMEQWELSDAKREILRKSGGAAIMLYRAQGEVEPEKGLAPSYMGLAVFTPELELVWRRKQPVITPEAPFHNRGVEDGRCTMVDGTCYFFYTGYFHDEAKGENHVQICLATSKDFIHWELKGPLEGGLNKVDNKNAVLFPKKIHGQRVLLHRPMQGEDAKAIHWAVAEDLEGPWKSRGRLMASYRFSEFSESWIGAGGPPISLGNNRYLTIYHQGHFTSEGKREYDLSATILEFPAPGECIVERRLEPLMRPTGAAEQQGDKSLGVDNVLFSCANYIWGDYLVIPYAGADSRIFGAKVNFEKLVSEIERA